MDLIIELPNLFNLVALLDSVLFYHIRLSSHSRFVTFDLDRLHNYPIAGNIHTLLDFDNIATHNFRVVNRFFHSVSDDYNL